jgi:hypothetical protein
MSQWSVEWLIKTDGGQRSIPAIDFLRTQPKSPRLQLLAILEAVRTVGPDGWKDRHSHRSMEGDLAHLHEARDRQDQMLYRLFLLWQRSQGRVVVIDGRAKPNGTLLPDAEYVAIRDLVATVDNAPPPFATADDFARTLLATDQSD